MLAHSTLIMLVTEFAQKAQGVAMSLVAFSLMLGGAAGTSIGGRLISAYGYKGFFLIFGLALCLLSLFASVVISEGRLAMEEPGPTA
jgi:predicted MFS family arabinose efflux permease